MRTAIGLMSGTSVDGVDVALIRSDGAWEVAFGPARTMAYAPERRSIIRSALGHRDPAQSVINAVTDAHVEAVRAFLKEESIAPSSVDWIGFHGQTTFHDPANGVTVQIGDGQALADAVRIPVVCDFRTADVADGGEGAPLAPLYHVALSARMVRPLAVLNLGGVGNVTWIGGTGSNNGRAVEETPVLAFDTGPASALLDDWIFRQTGEGFDRGGAAAARGKADEDRVDQWLKHPYFQRRPPKSLDRDAFDATVDDLSVEDGAATLTAFTVRAVTCALDWMPERPEQWIVTGGGRRNDTMMEGLRSALGVPVDAVESCGWDGDALEAQAFAWLALRVVDGLPTSVPGTTGVQAPTTGGKVYRPV